MKKLLIIGASILQLPAIKKAKELGFYVAVIDYDPDAIGIPFADEYFNVSTIDADGVSEVAKKFNPDTCHRYANEVGCNGIRRMRIVGHFYGYCN